MILKSPKFVLFGANLTDFGAKSESPDFLEVGKCISLTWSSGSSLKALAMEILLSAWQALSFLHRSSLLGVGPRSTISGVDSPNVDSKTSAIILSNLTFICFKNRLLFQNIKVSIHGLQQEIGKSTNFIDSDGNE